MKKILILNLMIFSLLCKSQSISPQVINSAGGGGQVGSSNVEVYYNIGEPIVSTISNSSNVITQGFLQPDIVGKFGLTVTTFSTNVTCADKTDGTIGVIATIGGTTNQSAYNISYYWNPDTLCQGAASTCTLVTGLVAGNYSLMVVSHYTGVGTIPDDTVRVQNIIINGNAEPCIINVYNGISPNGDGNNDFFYINNIDRFPDNNVEVYNRWGQKLFETDHYDNQTNAWRGTTKEGSQTAPAGTYFYIIDLGNGSKPIKGWLELTNSK